MKDEIVEVFSLLHDSYIELIEEDFSILTITISAEFIVNYINPDYTTLKVILGNFSSLEYSDWSDCETVYSDFITINQIARGIWITQCDLAGDDRISIHGHGGNSKDKTSCGGSIIFNCENYKIIDEGGNELSLNRLRELVKLYWKDFAQKV